MQRVEHAGAEIDEPDERRPSPFQLREDRLVELLHERDLVGDARTSEGLRSDCATRDAVGVDVGHDTDGGCDADALCDLLGHRLHAPTERMSVP